MYLFPMNHVNRDLETMFREFGRMFEPPRAETALPRLNVWSDAGGAVISAALPGVEPDAIDIDVHENKVRLSGRKDVNPEAGAAWHRNERRSGSFARTVVLPFRIDAAKVTAESRNGVLTIRLAREAADKPRKIAVTAA